MALAAGVLAGCIPPGPGNPKSGIEAAGSEVEDGWRYDFYINHDAPCSESSDQTFLVATRDGSQATTAAPLWVFMHGGGAGYYDSNGAPQPNLKNKQEEGADRLKGNLVGGLVDRVKASPEGFRLVAVSMCSHDTYAGNNTPDPNNDTPTTGLAHTLAVIDWMRTNYTTTGVILHGGSAGSVGTFHVGYWMQTHGDPPAAIVADSAVLNRYWQDAQNAIGPVLQDGSRNECYRPPEAMAGIQARWDPVFRTDDDQAHRRLGLDQLTVPVMHVWNTNDFNQCGSRPMNCPLPDGSTLVLGSTQCNNQPIHDVIELLPASRHTVDLEVCVNRVSAQHPEDCDWHVPTQTDEVPNTHVPVGDPQRDYNGFIMTWAEARLHDSP